MIDLALGKDHQRLTFLFQNPRSESKRGDVVGFPIDTKTSMLAKRPPHDGRLVVENMPSCHHVQGGASCHVGYRSCFYRQVPIGEEGAATGHRLLFKESEKVFDPEAVYGDVPNPTRL